MKKSVIIIISSIIAIVLILSCVIVFASSNKKEPTIEEKVSQEIDYLNNYIISILGDFNGLNTSQNNSSQEDQNKNQNNINALNNSIEDNVLDVKGKYEPNWDIIQNQIEKLYQTWNTVSIDLYTLNTADKTSILAFSDSLNSSTQNIKKKDKQKSIEEVIKLYQLLPQYSQSYRQNSKETNILKIKSNIVTSYANVTNEKWQEAETQLLEAEKQFANLLNSVNQEFENQTLANQCYILVNELIKVARLQDKDIFFIEYKNLMGKFETL